MDLVSTLIKPTSHAEIEKAKKRKSKRTAEAVLLCASGSMFDDELWVHGKYLPQRRKIRKESAKKCRAKMLHGSW
jgi:hypothetical protein